MEVLRLVMEVVTGSLPVEEATLSNPPGVKCPKETLATDPAMTALLRAVLKTPRTVLETPCPVLAFLFCRINCAFNSVNQIRVKSRESYCSALITRSQRHRHTHRLTC